jgi:hypothetical protein
MKLLSSISAKSSLEGTSDNFREEHSLAADSLADFPQARFWIVSGLPTMRSRLPPVWQSRV